MDLIIALALFASLLLGTCSYIFARMVQRRGVAWIARDSWFGWDKLDHFAWSLGFFLALAVVGLPGYGRWLFFLVTAYAVEAVELGRYASWLGRSKPSPRPAMCDALSWKDLLWDVAGALLAVYFIARLR